MEEDIRQALSVLRQGGIILYPTDTIWGIGCAADDTGAVDRIYRLKQREDSKSMLVLVEETGRLFHYVKEVPEMALQVAGLANSPVTIIYPGATRLAPNLVAADGSIGIRVCHDPFCQSLIRKLGKPLVSTSANRSGETPPGRFSEIGTEILSGVDYVVKWRQDERTRSKPSAILSIGLDGVVKIIRKGTGR